MLTQVNMSIAYDKYTELKSRKIQNSLTAAQQKQLADFEASQPETCPDCGATVRGFILKTEIVHDVLNCPRKKKPKE
ncbi:MAG: hypothetical protein QM813_26435 [Verrucomicrobiota bacterium]